MRHVRVAGVAELALVLFVGELERLEQGHEIFVRAQCADLQFQFVIKLLYGQIGALFLV
jgi:hypothetical protein